MAKETRDISSGALLFFPDENTTALDKMQAKIDTLEAQIECLQRRVDALEVVQSFGIKKGKE